MVVVDFIQRTEFPIFRCSAREQVAYLEIPFIPRPFCDEIDFLSREFSNRNGVSPPQLFQVHHVFQ